LAFLWHYNPGPLAWADVLRPFRAQKLAKKMDTSGACIAEKYDLPVNAMSNNRACTGHFWVSLLNKTVDAPAVQGAGMILKSHKPKQLSHEQRSIRN
jgi:hypothetical protein